MSVSSLKRGKVTLLMGAARRGIFTFLRQAYLIGADTFLRQKHLVFRAEVSAVLATPARQIDELTYREVISWQDWEKMTEDLRPRLSDPDENINWGSKDWFDKGWRLWVGVSGERLACLAWWRSAKQSRDFFCPLPDDSELLWHATVLPEFQGVGLQVPLWQSLMQERAAAGIRNFFTNCRDYNTPSHRNILKAGFRDIGFCTVSKITRRRKWHPASKK